MHTNSKLRSKSRVLPLLIAAAAIATLAVTVQAAAQQVNAPDPGTAQVKIKHVPITRVPVTSGQQMYTAYCADCHGATGKGNGPAAQALTSKPTDLTLLSARNDGKFPALQVNYMLTNEEQPSYGSTDMPSWCPAFRSLDRYPYPLVSLRVNNLVRYLKTLQAREQAKAH